MTFVQRVEAAFGADRTADPLSWSWTDLTARTRTDGDASVSIRRGLSSGSQQSAEGAMGLVLGNGDANLTPGNPVSVWYPNVRRGLPVRHYVNTGARHLELPGTTGARVSTPDHASLDITGDFSGAVEFGSPLRLPPPGDTYEVVGKWGAAGQRSWVLLLFEGQLWLRWSTDGTNQPQLGSQLGVPAPDSGPLTVGWALTVNIFGIVHAVQWYAIKGSLAELLADPAGATLGAAVVGSGTTSIFSSTAPVEIGDLADSGFAAYPGKIRRVQLRSGNLSGTVAANPDFTTQTVGAAGFADSTGKTWIVNPPATISDRKYRFIGELGAANPEWPANGVEGTAQVAWDVAGVLRRMRQGEPPLESAIRRAALSRLNAPNVVAYWPLEDGPDATVAASALAGGVPLRISGDFTFGQTDDSFPATRSLLAIGAGERAKFHAQIPKASSPPGHNWQVTVFFRIDDPPVSPALTTVFGVDANGLVVRWEIRINDTIVQVRGYDPTGVAVVDTTFPSDARFFDTWAIMRLDVTDDGASTDWAVSLIPTPLGLSFGTSGTIAVSPITGVPTAVRFVMGAPPSGIKLAHLAVSTTRPDSWLAPADTAYVGEPATQRIWRLCREESIPAVVDGVYGYLWGTDAAAGSRPMGPQRPLPLIDLLQECADVDGGILGESVELLGLSYRSGATLHNQPATITVEPVQPFMPADDDQDLVNDATVSRDRGASYRVADQDSIDDQGVYQDSRTVNSGGDWQAADHASWWLHEAGWPGMRYPDISFELVKPAAPLADWLDTNIGDHMTATGLPAEHPPDGVAQLLDGYTETISPHHWTVKANGRPAGPFEVAVLGDMARCKLDTAGSELASGITSTGTSLSVATTLGPIWTADDTEDGFDIEVGGERMTVTDISGASSPQTFTVTRSVNGVVKSHAAGATVGLWRPSVLALEGL